jgi:hypothetical protein
MGHLVDRFLAGPRWRWGRMAVAWVLIFTGAIIVGDVRGFVITLLGFVPFVESLYDVNLVAPLLRRPLKAEALRASFAAR